MLQDVLSSVYDALLLGGAANYDIEQKTERERSTKDLERLFFHLVKILQPSLFIEAGAKDASASRRARQIVSDARVVAFEANPYTYKRFEKRNAAAKGVEYLHCALSDQVGSITFNVLKTPDGTPRADGQGSTLARTDKSVGSEEVTVRATTIDTFFRDSKHDHIFMWVDVEGANEAVLTGARETLGSTSAVMIEVEDRRYWEGAWLRSAVVSYLREAGLIPIARDFQSRYQHNIVFVREAVFKKVDRVRWALTTHNSSSGRRPITAF